MVNERASRAAKQKATDKLHELGEQDAELLQFFEEDEPQLKRTFKRSGTDETSDVSDSNHNMNLDFDSGDDGETWKPESKKKRRRSFSGSDDDRSQGKKPIGLGRRRRQSIDQIEDENSASASDGVQLHQKESSISKKTKKKRRNSESDGDVPYGNNSKSSKRNGKKTKPRSISFEDDVNDLAADGEVDSDYHHEPSENDGENDMEMEGSEGGEAALGSHGKKKKKKKDKKSKKRPKDSNRHAGSDGEDDVLINGEENDEMVADKNEERPQKERAALYFGNKYRKGVKPLSSMVHTLLSQEQKAARTLALSTLEPRRDDETYRWPVREELLPSTMPEDSFVDLPKKPMEGDEHALRFVQELTGVPKTERDYSDSESDGESEDEGENELDEEYNSEAEEAIREAFWKRKRAARKKIKHDRHTDERAATTRLLQVQKLFNQEMTNFGRVQFRKGREQGLDNAANASFNQQSLPEFRNIGMRITKTSSAADTSAGNEDDDDPQEDLTTIQERALTFAAEDRTRKILDRLPWVIRQGALGAAPEYVVKGIPKPVSSEAEFERGWDTIMAAASLVGVEDRILKKVGIRMKSLLSHSIHPGRYEPAPKVKFADADKMGSDAIAKSMTPHYRTGEFIDPLDPRYRREALIENQIYRERQVPFNRFHTRYPKRLRRRKGTF